MLPPDDKKSFNLTEEQLMLIEERRAQATARKKAKLMESTPDNSGVWGKFS